jgi:hypothetical protein
MSLKNSKKMIKPYVSENKKSDTPIAAIKTMNTNFLFLTNSDKTSLNSQIIPTHKAPTSVIPTDLVNIEKNTK